MLKTGKIGLSYVMNLIQETFSGDSSGQGIHGKLTKMGVLTKTLQKRGGLLSKIAQVLAFEHPDTTAYDRVEPEQMKSTHQNFVYRLEATPPPYSVDSKEVYRSGSIGQVYTGEYKGEKIAIKVKYLNIHKSIEEDVSIVETISCYTFGLGKQFLKAYMTQIKDTMLREIDYPLEVKNHKLMHETWDGVYYVKIPKIYPELCDSDTIVTQFVEDGQSFDEFLKTATQEEKNKIGLDIVRFVFTSFYEHRLLYSDIHPGNFIITKDKKGEPIINVLDFGCMHTLDKSTHKYLKKIHKSLKRKNDEKFIKYARKISFLKLTEDEEKNEELINQYLKCYEVQYRPWVQETEFHFNEEWMETYKTLPSIYKDVKISSELLYVHRILFNLNLLLMKLNAKGRFYEIFNSLIPNHD